MSKTLKLLHVEDDDGDAKFVERALAREFSCDCILTRVRCMREAIEQLRESPFDAILLDLGLQDIRGISGVRAIRDESPDLPIVVLTGTDNNEMALSAVRNGAQEYLVKDHSNSRAMGLAVLSSIERKAYERSLFRAANHDELTGLPNRRMFLEYLKRCLIRASVWKRTEAILFLDLNGFKRVNDTLGHDAGDLVLEQCATRLKLSLRPSDMLARFGGDEFVVHLDASAHVTREVCVEVAKRISQLFEEPILVDGKPIALGISVGVAMYPDHGKDSAELIQNADMAMYIAKRDGTSFAFASEPPPRPLPQLATGTDGQRRATPVGFAM